MSHYRRMLLYTGLIILITIIMRIAPLFFGGIWNDELFTLKIATYPLRQIEFLTSFDRHPPFFYQYIHLAMRALQICGPTFISLGWLRFAVALPSILLTLLLALWAWRAWGRAAALTAWTTALLVPAMSFYACELRSYSLLTLIVAMSSLALFRGLATASLSALALYTVLAMAGLMVHYQMIFIIFFQGLWTVDYLWCHRRTLSATIRLSCLAPFLLIAAFLAPAVSQIYEKHLDCLACGGGEIGPVKFRELPAVLFYDFPAGPVEQQSMTRPYGIMAILVFAGLFVAQMTLLVYNRRRLKYRPGWDGLPAYCLFLMFGYLVLTWTLTYMKINQFFSGERLSTLVLPFWILLVTVAIEKLARFKTRQRARRILIHALLPGMVISLAMRMEWRDDFRPLFPNRAITVPLPDDRKSDMDYYLADTACAPWLRNVLGVASILPLKDLQNETTSTGKDLVVINIDNNYKLRSDADNIEEFVIHTWAAQHRLHQEHTPMMNCPILYTLTCTSIPASQRQDFVKYLRKAKELMTTGNKRAPEELILQPYAREFSAAEGLCATERDRDTFFRWTNGVPLTMRWQAPEHPGDYGLQLFFYRPYPLPSKDLDIDYCFPQRTQFKTLWTTVGSVILKETIHTSQPFEPISFMMLTTPWISRTGFPGGGEGYHRSLIFARLEMKKLAAHPEMVRKTGT